MKWHELGPFTVFDVETTGMSPVYDEVVELAALRINCDGSESEFHSLVNPGRTIPRGVTMIHHISDDMVKNAPNFATVGKEFCEFAKNSTLVAHNARFDLGFLQEGLNRYGLPLWDGKTLDSVRLLHRVYPGLPGYSLEKLRMYFKLDEKPGMQAHRAGSDVRWTVDLLSMALEKVLESQNK